MSLRWTLVVLAALSVVPEPRYFRYERALAGTDHGSLQPGQTCAVIEPQIYSHAASGLADLRLYAGSGSSGEKSETPYVLRASAPGEVVPQPIALLNKGSQGGRAVFDADLPEGAYSDLVLDVSAQNFIAAVHVSGSKNEDGKAETDLGTHTIFDFTSQRLGRSTVLHLPEFNFPHLHFSVDGPLEAGSFDSFSVSSVAMHRPRYLTVLATQSVSATARTSVARFNLPAHTTVDRIAFALGAKPALFSRDVRVLVVLDAKDSAGASQGREDVRPQASYLGTLLRIHTVQNGHKIDEERLEVDTSGAEFDVPSTWTITVENGDDAPLALQSVRLEMRERKLCFDAAAGMSYTLLYGDAALSAPNYDYARLFTQESNPQVATIAGEKLNAAYVPRPDARPFTERHPVLLWVTLIGVIALLAVIAIQSMTKLKTTQP